MAPSIFDRIQGYFLPAILIVVSIGFYVYTAVTSPTLLFTNLNAYRERAFTTLWVAFAAAKLAADTPSDFAALLAQSRGTILDVGPGSGNQLFRFSHPENIERIYGVEPAVTLHAELKKRAEKAGLGGKYRVLTAGAEEESLVPALAREGLLGDGGEKVTRIGDGVFDEIVCIRMLCGVSRPRETIAGLYQVLKPGGRFVLFEHVVSDAEQGHKLGWGLQRLYSALGWSFLMGNCDLRRDTAALLMDAAKADGGWAKVQLQTVDDWSTLPHIFGYCMKKA